MMINIIKLILDLFTKTEKNKNPQEGLSSEQIKRIKQVVNCFETSIPEGNYSKVTIFNDGPNKIKQITYGASQTTQYGNLNILLKEYANKNGKYSKEIGSYVGKMNNPSLVNDKKFIELLMAAGKDPVMQEVQDKFFDDIYFKPAQIFWKDNGFKTALSLLVIYDSYIHSGGILSFLRSRFPEYPPAKGGNERKWIESYVNVRHDWLSNHSNSLLRNTVYRTNTFKQLLKNSEWDLKNSILTGNGCRTK